MRQLCEDLIQRIVQERNAANLTVFLDLVDALERLKELPNPVLYNVNVTVKVNDKKMGQFMACLRKNKGMKQGEVAAIMGVSPPLISQLETGSRSWSEWHVKEYMGIVQ
jgi:DNA-binding XRE family transcriptional regulator